MRWLALCAVAVFLATASSNGDEAKDILEATGVKGGLVVHLGCGDGKLTAALHANDRYLVHGQVKELPGYMATVSGDIVCLGGK